MNRRELLQKVPLFAGLGDAELGPAPDDHERLRTRQTLFRHGDPAGRALRRGERAPEEIVRELGDRELVFDVVGPGAVIGELALLGEKEETRSASAVASSAVELLAIDRRNLLAFLRRHPGVALALCAALADRVRRLDAQLMSATFLGLEQRLARTLVNLAARFAGPAPAGGEL